jgi:hypothetical protein
MYKHGSGFDWKGFRFALLLVLASFVIGGATFQGMFLMMVQIFADRSQQPIFIEALSLSPPLAAAATLSTTTPQRVINSLRLKDVIPDEGKFVAADLVAMQLYVYEDGNLVAEYPIQTKGRSGTPWETPSGIYAVQTKEKNHFSTIGKVYMPYSMQFYGNYFIHGWTYYPDGTPTSAGFSGGCIKLETEDAEKVFAFADLGTQVFVYDNKQEVDKQSLSLGTIRAPWVSAQSYIVADIDTGDVYLEQNAGLPQPIASVTKLVTALVANETISFDKELGVSEGLLTHPQNPTDTKSKKFLVNDLFYPLLMESNNEIADRLASYYGTGAFVNWMNMTAKALDMQSTRFADPSGKSSDNMSTPDDLFKLVTYLINKKSFVLKITRTPEKKIEAQDGSSYEFKNFNIFSDQQAFIGGKVGHTTAAQDTMASAFTVKVNGEQRRIAIIVLKSNDYTTDTKALLGWFQNATLAGWSPSPACVACTEEPEYRKIEI